MRMIPVVVDTNTLVAAMLGKGPSASRTVIRRCLQGAYQPLIGAALFTEYQAVMARASLFRRCSLTKAERETLLNVFYRVCRWTPVYYSWRPNLPDEGDNHILELAVAGGAVAIVTRNIRDFINAELGFPGIRILTPEKMIKEY